MANAYRVKQYLQHLGEDSSLSTFTDVEDAKIKIGLSSSHTGTNGNPTTSYALSNGNQTLVVTYEFASEDDQNTWYDAMTGTWYVPSVGSVNYIKVEWLHEDGTISATTNFES